MLPMLGSEIQPEHQAEGIDLSIWRLGSVILVLVIGFYLGVLANGK